MAGELTIGAVAYDPKVVTIWEGFRTWFRERGTPTTFVLYADYERQVEDLLAGRVDVAWNSPLAWVRSRRLAEADGRKAIATAMRDTDQDLTSIVLVRADVTANDETDQALLRRFALFGPPATIFFSGGSEKRPLRLIGFAWGFGGRLIADCNGLKAVWISPRQLAAPRNQNRGRLGEGLTWRSR